MMIVGSPEYRREQAAVALLKEQRGDTEPFVVGRRYYMRGGGTVKCLEIDRECARFDDEIWRYDRNDIDRGRVTGSPFDHSDPRCVIPHPKQDEPDPSALWTVMECPESKDSHMGCPTCGGKWYVRTPNA